MGDVGAGKTRLTKWLLEEALDMGLKDITVIDMAPRAVEVNGVLVGGVLVEGSREGVRCLRSDDIKTPRLSAGSADELLRLADHNLREVEKLLDSFKVEPTETLFVNDASIYLQRGDPGNLWASLVRAETVVANGYMGKRLAEDRGTGLSRIERERMKVLASKMDMVVRL